MQWKKLNYTHKQYTKRITCCANNINTTFFLFEIHYYEKCTQRRKGLNKNVIYVDGCLKEIST